MVNALSRLPLFAPVERTELARTANAAELCRVCRGETIYTPRQFRRSLGVLLEGKIRVDRASLEVSVLGAGEVFGAAALFGEGGDYATTLTALTDCAVAFLPQEEVTRLLRASPDFAESYTRYLSGRIRFLSGRLNAVSAAGAERKLAAYLLAADGGSGCVTISAAHLAGQLGMGRATLYRAFDLLERDGAIRREGKSIRILDRNKLES